MAIGWGNVSSDGRGGSSASVIAVDEMLPVKVILHSLLIACAL